MAWPIAADSHRRVSQNGDTKGIGEEIVEVEDEGEFEGEDAVIDLTDATFEELTQAATGATTGDWVVMFYAPWYVFTCSCAARNAQCGQCTVSPTCGGAGAATARSCIRRSAGCLWTSRAR